MSEQTGGTTTEGPDPTSAGTTALSTSTTVEQFYDAALTVKHGPCAPVPDGLCGERERLALVHPLPRPPHAVYDRQFFGYPDAAADYDLWLATASRPVEPVQCEDVPPAWFQALMTSSFGP